MFSKYVVLSLMVVINNSQCFSDCFMCEEIRERNKNLPPLKHEYYDEYLEELKLQGKPIPGEIDFGEEQEEAAPKKSEELFGARDLSRLIF